MTNYNEVDRPPVLAPAEIEKLLSMKLIANLATIDDDGGIHMVPMWFLRVAEDICIPTSRNTHKYRNVRKKACASVMIDISRAGLNLKGVLIRGRVELTYGEEAIRINRLIHLKYVTPEALNDVKVASYLSREDDVTVKVQYGSHYQLEPNDSSAGKALSVGSWFYPLDDELVPE